MNRTVLLQRLQGVYQRLVLGDTALARKVAEWKRLAKAGNPKAKVVYNSLAVLHWQRRDTLAFARAEVFYNRLRAYDREAHAELRRIIGRKNAGDPQSTAFFSILKAVHHKRKASLWSNGPGSPQTGYHPMPSHHRIGIDIPGALGQMSQYGQQWLGAPAPYLPLTPQALAMLIQLIQQVLAGARPMLDRSVNPSYDAAQASVAPVMADEWKPRIMSTTPKPATMSLALKPVLSSTAQMSSPTSVSRIRSLL